MHEEEDREESDREVSPKKMGARNKARERLLYDHWLPALITILMFPVAPLGLAGSIYEFWTAERKARHLGLMESERFSLRVGFIVDVFVNAVLTFLWLAIVAKLLGLF